MSVVKIDKQVYGLDLDHPGHHEAMKWQPLEDFCAVSHAMVADALDIVFMWNCSDTCYSMQPFSSCRL